MAGYVLRKRSRTNPKIKDGISTDNAHSGGWVNQCPAMNNTDVAQFPNVTS